MAPAGEDVKYVEAFKNLVTKAYDQMKNGDSTFVVTLRELKGLVHAETFPDFLMPGATEEFHKTEFTGKYTNAISYANDTFQIIVKSDVEHRVFIERKETDRKDPTIYRLVVVLGHKGVEFRACLGTAVVNNGAITWGGSLICMFIVAGEKEWYAPNGDLIDVYAELNENSHSQS